LELAFIAFWNQTLQINSDIYKRNFKWYDNLKIHQLLNLNFRFLLKIWRVNWCYQMNCHTHVHHLPVSLRTEGSASIYIHAMLNQWAVNICYKKHTFPPLIAHEYKQDENQEISHEPFAVEHDIFHPRCIYVQLNINREKQCKPNAPDKHWETWHPHLGFASYIC
jgi:hypothetical protein